MTGRFERMLRVVLALASAGLAVPVCAQTPESTPRQVLERQERALTKDIRERNARLQALEREVNALERGKNKAKHGKSARFNAKINRLQTERKRLRRVNQSDILDRNRLRGKR